MFSIYSFVKLGLSCGTEGVLLSLLFEIKDPADDEPHIPKMKCKAI